MKLLTLFFTILFSISSFASDTPVKDAIKSHGLVLQVSELSAGQASDGLFGISNPDFVAKVYLSRANSDASFIMGEAKIILVSELQLGSLQPGESVDLDETLTISPEEINRVIERNRKYLPKEEDVQVWVMLEENDFIVDDLLRSDMAINAINDFPVVDEKIVADSHLLERVFSKMTYSLDLNTPE